MPSGYIDTPERAYNIIDNTVRVRVEKLNESEYWFHRVNTSSSTVETILTPSSGKCIRIVSMIISTSGANDVAFVFGTSTLCSFMFNEKKSVPVSFPFEVCGGINQPLKVVVSSSGTVDITVIGFEE